MKNIILAFACCISSTSFAQFKIDGGSMTVQNGAILTLDSLTLQPNADMTLGNTELQISNSPSPVNSGNTINKSYNFSNPFNFSGTAILQYADAALNGNAEANLQMVYSTTNSPIVWLTTSGSIINMTTNTLSQTFNNVNIASVSASSENTFLALELISFEARKSINEKYAILNWTMSSVENMLEFVIEKSKDGNEFYPLANVPVSQVLRYEQIDNEPFSGLNLYRLKMIDNGNNVTYSEIRSLKFGSLNSEINLYPNPTQTTFTIHTKDITVLNTIATVFDLNGKVINRFVLNKESTTISAQEWAIGMYLIKLENGQIFKLDKR